MMTNIPKKLELIDMLTQKEEYITEEIFDKINELIDYLQAKEVDPPEHEESPHGYKLRHEDCEDCIKATGDAWQPKMNEYVSKEKIKRVIEESADYTKYPHYGDYKIGTFMNIFQHGLEERARVIIESLGLGD